MGVHNETGWGVISQDDRNRWFTMKKLEPFLKMIFGKV
jgi:hypothetical protein